VSDFNLSRFVGITPTLSREELLHVMSACKAALDALPDVPARIHYLPPDSHHEQFEARTGDPRVWSACGGAVLWTPFEDTWGGPREPSDTDTPRSTDPNEVTCGSCQRTKVYKAAPGLLLPF
jgi:hypothetical protein